MAIPDLDLQTSERTEIATFAMGCFWSPDALFGSINGVVRTRVGYAGGTTKNPSYWQLTDHIETVQLEYDPAILSYENLLQLFFSNHKPTREPWKRQYASAIFYHNPEQEKPAYLAKEQLEAQAGQKVFTEIHQYKEFYLAEERHQKYKLQRRPALWEEFEEMYPDFYDRISSTAAARVNAYLYGYGSRKELEANIGGFGLSPAAQHLLLQKAAAPKHISCDAL
ncbi:peptide-methionine (S)-S-oxide reductase MsrA [Pontibacter korlensis]|uniref:peptide-methionine (S)-S-oxide reductase MsrA n=1 Tax=Pontibacter korlensis TaxID=400092 RepID=UPI00061AEDC2|nr:peptide-methionine (S)-S-oxide reductase MsrA [Pontibacter korlensis]